MKKTYRFPLAVAMMALAGCAEPSEDSAETEGAAAVSPWPALVAEARAVRLNEGDDERVVGAPAKVKTVLESLSRATTRRASGNPRCDSVRFTLDLASGVRPIGEIEACSGTRALLHLDRAHYEVQLAEAPVRAVFAQPLALGDLAWGVATVILDDSRPLGGDAAESFMKGFDLDAVIVQHPAAGTPEAATACPSDMSIPGTGPFKSIKLRRADGASAGMIDLHCGADPDGAVSPALVTSPYAGELGWVTYDMEAAFRF